MENNILKETRGVIKLSDFRLKNLHPKAKMHILLAITGTLFVIFECFYMLSVTVFYFDVNFNTSEGLSHFFSNLVFFGYIIGSIFVIIILWYVMIKDCPISPAAKINYEMSHDKSTKSVKVIITIISAIINKGDKNSIESVTNAINEYFTTKEEIVGG